ncbi:MAG: bifunctional 3-(3-hydroxy-phenyl)propionate/3-hydroxycinnamic acid hydroxylase [Rhodobacteraceae bacterium]|nr:bifunctional 3-(3-hydroxy-phenyl)propionate/3-hydroxycinnamic acid hydroxylase [Paracoccaceae bacterium]
MCVSLARGVHCSGGEVQVQHKEFDVVIVGYGPVGATLANLLGMQKLSLLVIEREGSVYHQPRAGHMDGEVVRIFQSVGLADEIVATAYVNPGMRFVNAAGELILDWPRPKEPGPEGWHPSYRFHQPALETSLRRGVSGMPDVSVLLRHEAVRIEGKGDRVIVGIRDLEGGEERQVAARYVVGCDGARSTVRRAMGVELEDLKSHQQWLIVDVGFTQGPDTLPVETIQYCDPARPVTMAKMVGNRRRWEFMLMPGEKPEEMARPEAYWPLLERWTTPEAATVERAVVYTFHSVIAGDWRRGRMLLAGDACHQTPPFMGQGMCAGIRDAANLAWKLGAVLRGRAPEALLDTYQSERAPHVRTFIETAVRLGNLVNVTDADAADRRDAMLRREPQVMKTPAPPLGPGLSGTAAPPAGTRARQLVLADGRRSDDAVGPGFGLFARAGLAAAIDTDLPVFTDGDPAVDAWLDELGATAVVVRPDRYILGIANDAAALSALLARIPVLEVA